MAFELDRRSLFRSTGAAVSLVAAGLSVGAARGVGATTYNGPVRLVANENPYGPSASAQAAMTASVSDGWMYVTADGRALRDIIAEREGVGPDNVLITAGSGELLKMAGLSYGQTGDVVAARPTFSMLMAYVRNTGGTVHEVDLDANMMHDLAGMESRITAKTSLVYVCNPNNPTGTLLDGDTLRTFIDTVEDRVTVLVDEAYVDLQKDPHHNSMIDQVKVGKNVILARTFSKIHGMAGLRIGYAIARIDLIKRLRPLQMSFLNVMGIRAAVASYQDLEFQSFSKSKIQDCVALTQTAFAEVGLPYTPSHANFILFDTGGSVREFSIAMRKKNMLVGRSYAPYRTWCRVSMGTVEQMEVFAEALKDYYKG